jgi:LL-H family phage holin
MPENIMQAINEIIPEVMSVIALAVIYYVKLMIATWQPKLQAMIDANVSANNQAIIKGLGRECLAYAEKEFPNSDGAFKLNEAIKRFNARAIQLGLTNLSGDTVRAAIEQAWLEIWGDSPKG